MTDLVSLYYEIAEKLDDNTMHVAIMLKVVGAKEPIKCLHNRLEKLNLDKNASHIKETHKIVLLHGDIECLKAQLSYIQSSPKVGYNFILTNRILL